VFATDPSIPPEESGYREVYATEALSPSFGESLASGS